MISQGIVTVYFIKQKSEFFETFKLFKDLTENMQGNKIKVFRNENGKEYVNNNLQHLCHDSGIHIQHFVPYTPQQNGVAECKNKTLKKMETCMMEKKDLSPNIWVEAINCAAYVQNRAPHK